MLVDLGFVSGVGSERRNSCVFEGESLKELKRMDYDRGQGSGGYEMARPLYQGRQGSNSQANNAPYYPRIGSLARAPPQTPLVPSPSFPCK